MSAKGWLYPEHNSFVFTKLSDGTTTAVMIEVILPVGTLVDRFGFSVGWYLAPTGTPFGLRTVPMENLSRNLPRDDKPAPPFNYYQYIVTQEFCVYAGPIAPTS
jgi:hypothetical protein